MAQQCVTTVLLFRVSQRRYAGPEVLDSNTVRPHDTGSGLHSSASAAACDAQLVAEPGNSKPNKVTVRGDQQLQRSGDGQRWPRPCKPLSVE